MPISLKPLEPVRALARDLRISVITTTRAYAELAAEGFIATVPGKGAYVLPLSSELLLRQAEEGLQAAPDAARRAGLERDDLVRMLDGLLSAETEETWSSRRRCQPRFEDDLAQPAQRCAKRGRGG